ncbi:hypothetical protein HAX54_009170, partial [Datura stramonium]|nr:hypothetical protein [Datura stramonium]
VSSTPSSPTIPLTPAPIVIDSATNNHTDTTKPEVRDVSVGQHSDPNMPLSGP